MNNKLLLVTGITLLYRESQIPDRHENSSGLVRQVISSIKIPDTSLGIDREREILEGLRSTALSMCDAPVEHEYEETGLLQRLKLNTLDDDMLFQSLMDGIIAKLSPEAIKKACVNMKRDLSNHFREEKVNEIMSKASYALKFERSKISDMSKFVSQVLTELEPYQTNMVAKDPAVVHDIDVSNINAVAGIYGDIQDEATGLGIMQCGYQGINRMLDGGFRRGEQWVVGALQHNYKTGFSLSIFKQLALYNKPHMIDPAKKPLLLRISFEDSAQLNFQFLYKSLKENETGQKADIAGLSDIEIAKYVYEKLSVNGYHVRIMQVNPSLWTYRDICNKIIELEAEGFEIHVCMVDYLLKVPTTGCDKNAAGEDIRNMYERLYNFMKPRRICFITPHQLSTDAKQLIRDGRQGFVQELTGRGYYAGCKQIDQVVDGEVYIHIEKMNNKSYLTVQRGKHRKIEQTATEYLYCVLPFEDVGGIRDDINGPDSTRKKVGGGPIGSSDEIPFWEAE